MSPLWRSCRVECTAVQSSLNTLGAVYIAALYSVVIMFVAYFILPSCVQIFAEDPKGELKIIAGAWKRNGGYAGRNI